MQMRVARNLRGMVESPREAEIIGAQTPSMICMPFYHGLSACQPSEPAAMK